MGRWVGTVWGVDFARRIQAERFRVHSVFDKVCNLQSDPSLPLLSLVSRSEGLAPNALWIDGVSFREWFCAGEAVQYRNASLRIGDINISIEDLRTSEALIAKADCLYMQQETGQKINSQTLVLVQEWLESQAPGFTQRSNPRVSALSESLLLGDEVRLRIAMSRFIGVGPGLTPSGDDFLAGVMLGLVRGGCYFTGVAPKTKAFLKGLPAMISSIWNKTNAISQTMLWYAVRGEGAAYLTEAVDSLYMGVPQALMAAQRLFRVGASSGRYLLAGILLGCEICLEREQFRYGRKSGDPVQYVF